MGSCTILKPSERIHSSFGLLTLPLMHTFYQTISSGIDTLGHWPYHQSLWPHHQNVCLSRDLTYIAKLLILIIISVR